MKAVRHDLAAKPLSQRERGYLRAADADPDTTPGSALWLHGATFRALDRLRAESVDIDALFSHAGDDAAQRWLRAEILAVTDRVVLDAAAPVVASREAIDLARAIGRRRDPLTALCIAYGFVQAEVQADLASVAPASGHLVATHFATVLGQLAQIHAHASAAPDSSTEANKRAALQQALRSAALTASELRKLSDTLRYDLHGEHRCYVVHAVGAAGEAAVAHAVDDLLASAGASRRLGTVIAARGYVWIAGPALAPELLEGLLVRHQVAVGESHTAPGLRGFRRTREQAVIAAEHAELCASGAPVRCRYADIDMVALAATDLGRARAFAAETLGPLYSNDPDMVGLRQTLGTVLVTGSLVAAAARLAVHKNTVAYRVRRCEQLLERPVTANALQLHSALELAAVLFGEATDRRVVAGLSARLG